MKRRKVKRELTDFLVPSNRKSTRWREWFLASNVTVYLNLLAPLAQDIAAHGSAGRCVSMSSTKRRHAPVIEQPRIRSLQLSR